MHLDTQQLDYDELLESLEDTQVESLSDTEKKELFYQAEQAKLKMLEDAENSSGSKKEALDIAAAKVQTRLDALKLQTDIHSSSETAHQPSLDDATSSQQTADASPEQHTSDEDGSGEKEEKSFFGTMEDSLVEGLDKVNFRDKDTKERNLKNPWLWVSSLALGAGIIRGIRKIRSWRKNRKEKKESQNTGSTNQQSGNEKNWFQRNWGWMFGGALTAGVGAGALYVWRDKLRDMPLIGALVNQLYPKDELSFEDAISLAQGNMQALAKEEHLRQDMKLEREPGSDVVYVLGEPYNIDMKKKTIEGLSIQFSNYEELITTLLIIASAKDAFGGMGSGFALSNGNIVFNASTSGNEALASGTGFPRWTLLGTGAGLSLGAVAGGYVAGVPGALGGGALGGIAGGAAGYMADHNNTIAKISKTLDKTKNKERVIAYLNRLDIREGGNDEQLKEKLTTTNDRVNELVYETLHSLQREEDYRGDRDSHNNAKARNSSINNYEARDDVFELTSRGRKTYIECEFDTNGDIVSAKVEDIPIKFVGESGFKEAVYLANVINWMTKKLVGKGYNADPFDYRRGTGPQAGGREIGWSLGFRESLLTHETVLSSSRLNTYLPTVMAGTASYAASYKGKNLTALVEWLNTRRSGATSLWRATGSNGRDNDYLKNLD